jgi:hypothetical protein
MATKIDFKKTLDGYQAKRDQFRVVQLPAMQYLMIDGHGDPNTSPAYTQALHALYPVAYKMKFASKRELGRDYVVPPLEGLWWAEDMNAFTGARDKSQWDWTLMILVPDWINKTMFHNAIDVVRAKGDADRLDDVRIATLAEGLCVQTLHIGSFDDEAAILEQMHEVFIPSQGLAPSGKHHEIYFSDFRKLAPDKFRTILRQPVTKASI